MIWKNRPTLGDQMKGAWRNLRNGNAMNLIAGMREIYRVRDERLAREAGDVDQYLKRQLAEWARRFGDGRSDSIKVVYKPDAGYSDIYFGGQGEPDGPGHGHIRVFEDGSEKVVREPFKPGEPSAKLDATLLDDRTRDKRI